MIMNMCFHKYIFSVVGLVAMIAISCIKICMSFVAAAVCMQKFLILQVTM